MVTAPLGRMDITAVYERNADVLYRIALAQLQSKEDAEDAVHDVFSRFIEKSPAFSDIEHERAWLIRVTLNRCNDLKRRLKHRIHVPLDDALELPDEMGADAKDEMADLLGLISKLPEKYRSAVVLHYLEDMPIDAVAKSLGISVSAVKMRLMRSREMMHKLMGKE